MKTAILATPRATDIPVVTGATYIGVDAGALRLQEAGIAPAFAVGDFDSMSPDALEQMKKTVPIERHPVMKDESDAELAVAIAKEKGFEVAIVLVGRLWRTVSTTRSRICGCSRTGRVIWCCTIKGRWRFVWRRASTGCRLAFETFHFSLWSQA